MHSGKDLQGGSDGSCIVNNAQSESLSSGSYLPHSNDGLDLLLHWFFNIKLLLKVSGKLSL